MSSQNDLTNNQSLEVELESVDEGVAISWGEESTQTPREDVKEAFRSLLLPLSHAKEAHAIAKVQELLTHRNVSPEDQSAWIKNETDTWIDTGRPSRTLKSVIEDALQEGDEQNGTLLKEKYFKLHKELINQFEFTHAQASDLLSYSGLATRLAKTERMSSAQIAKVLSATNANYAIKWNYISKLLSGLDLEPKLEKSSMQQVVDADEEMEVNLFADLDATEGAEMISETGARLGFSGDLRTPLLSLLNPAGDVYGPYLQMLFYQCLIVEFYDHPVSVSYEFQPRGNDPEEVVFSRFPSVMGVVGNPYLNNAKGAGTLNMQWAEGRRDPLVAESLVSILLGMETMSYASRRELAAWIRRWILRIIRLQQSYEEIIAESVTLPQIVNVLQAVSQNETHTTGIIEQRLVDFLTSIRFDGKSEWRSRGHGDSVNASNVSKRKLGDCDYQNALKQSVFAYEAHAGKLTDVYVKEHMRTLKRVLGQRKMEWEAIEDIEKWKVELVFVAHDITSVVNSSGSQRVLDIPINIEFYTFSQWSNNSNLDEGVIPLFVEKVIRPLNEKRTPNYVRKQMNAYLASGGCGKLGEQ